MDSSAGVQSLAMQLQWAGAAPATCIEYVCAPFPQRHIFGYSQLKFVLCAWIRAAVRLRQGAAGPPSHSPSGTAKPTCTACRRARCRSSRTQHMQAVSGGNQEQGFPAGNQKQFWKKMQALSISELGSGFGIGLASHAGSD